MTEKSYKHFVIIRFNIRVKFGCNLREPNNNPMEQILDEAYLEERFKLFETYTLPSLKMQTCQNFEVIVLFHKETPEKYKERVAEQQREYPFLLPLYFSDSEKFDFEEFVQEKFMDEYPYFVTSRLDNDDMYAPTYIETIQEYIASLSQMRTCFFSFKRGEKFDLQEGKRYEFDYMQNHFLSMLAPASTNVLKYDHSTIEQSGHEIVPLEPDSIMWTEIVHNSNVANKIVPYVKYQHAIYQLEHFGNRKITKNLNLVIYGVGKLGQAVYEKLKDKYKVVCFVDEKSSMQEYDKVPVLKIKQLSQLYEEYGIVIAVSYEQEMITRSLRAKLGEEIEIKDISKICEHQKTI